MSCNSCERFKWSHTEYNYCPICGKKLKSFVFVPGHRLNKVPSVELKGGTSKPKYIKQ